MPIFTPPVIDASVEIPNAGRGLQRWHNQNASGKTNTEAYRRTGLEWSYHEGSTPGSYDWTKLDQEISANAGRGQRTIIAIATTRGTDTYSGAWVPAYLLEKDANGVLKYGAWYPFVTGTDGNSPKTDLNGNIQSGFFLIWSSLYVRERWLAFLMALAARYDGDPRVLAFDMTAVGAYGEWYISSSAPGRVQMNNERRMWVIDSYHTAFKKTPLRMGTDDEIALKLCFDKYPKDSWYRMSWGRHEHFDGKLHEKYDSYPPFWERWKTANSPIGIETYGTNFTIDTTDVQDIIDNHVSLIGDGNFVTVSYANIPQAEKDLFIEAGRKAGYRYVLRDVTVPSPAPGAWAMSVVIENIGCAPTYDNWEMVVQLRSSEYTVIWEGILDTVNLKTLLPEHGAVLFSKTFVLPSTISASFQYRVNLAIRDKNPNLAGMATTDGRRFVLRNLLPANGGALEDRSIFLGTIGTGTPPPPPQTGNITLRTPNGFNEDNKNGITLTPPPSSQDDDWLYPWFVNRTPGATVNMTNNGTLSLLADIPAGSTIRLVVYKHRYDPATSPADWTFSYANGSTGDWQGGFLPVGGNDELMPIDNNGTAFSTTTGASGSIELIQPQITTVTANTRLIEILTTAFAFNDIVSRAGVMNRLAQYRNSAVSITTGIFEELFATPGQTGTRTFDYSAARSAGILFAVKPAVSAPPPVVPVLTVTPELVAYESSDNDANLFRVFTNLSASTTVDVLANYQLTPQSATIPGDVTMTALTGTWTIPAGTGSGDDTFFAIRVANDLLSEPDETFKLEVTSVTNATLADYPAGGWTLTIKDDDQTTATAYFSGYPDAVVSNGAVNDSFFEHSQENITVTLDAPLAYQTTLTFTTTPIGWTEGVHYTVTPANKQLVFAVGETQKTITITPVNDVVQNPSRSLSVALGSGNGIVLGSPRIINFVIQDDEAVVTPTPTRPAIPTGYTGFFVEGSGIQHIWNQNQNASSYDLQWAVGTTANPEPLLTDYVAAVDRYLQDDLYERGLTYFYRLRARNTVGYSDWTDWVQVVVPGLPPTPQPVDAPLLSAREDDTPGGVYLSWPIVTNGSDYEARVSTNLSDWTTIGKAGTLFRRHQPDTSGGIQDWFYQVRAVNNVGQPGPWSNVVLVKLVVQPPGTIAFTTKGRVWPADETTAQDVIDSVRLSIEDPGKLVISDGEILLYIREAMKSAKKHFVEVERLVYKLPASGSAAMPITFYVPKDYHKHEPLSIRLCVPGWSQLITRFEWKRDTIELRGYPVQTTSGYYEVHYMTPCEAPVLPTDTVSVPRTWLVASTLVRLLPLYAKRTGTDQMLAIQEQMNRAMSEFQSAVRTPFLHEDGTIR